MYKILAKTLFIGKEVIYLPTCHSTNKEAATLLNQRHVFEGTIVVTDNQTDGKGQRGNQWESAPGENLTFSVIVRPGFIQIDRQFDLNIVVALGIHDFLSSLAKGFQMKWPNDLYYCDKKVCGILIQNNVKNSGIQSSIIGVGLNVNQYEFKEAGATSLCRILNRPLNRFEIFEWVNKHIETRYLQLRSEGPVNLREEYIKNLYWFGEDHLYQDQHEGIFNGRIVGISKEGRLELQTKSGIEQFALKEIEFLS